MQDCKNCIHGQVCRYREQREELDKKAAELAEGDKHPLAVQVVCRQHRIQEPIITKKEPLTTKIGDWPPGIQIGDSSLPYTTKFDEMLKEASRGGENHG